MLASEFDKHPELGEDFWAQHPEHTLEDWQDLVSNDDTRLGYWDWVLVRLDEDDEDDDVIPENEL